MNTQDFWKATDLIQKTTHSPHYCLPEDVTNGDILEVFNKYLNYHPEELNKPAAFLLVEALAKAFACTEA